MTSDRGQKNRQIIPRWNPSSVAFDIGDTMDLHSQQELGSGDVQLLARKQRRWEEVRTTWAGIDLLGTAAVLQAVESVGVDDAVAALRRTQLSHSQQAVVDSVALESTVPSAPVGVRESVRRLRLRLIRHPRDAIAWIDLAYIYGLLRSTRRAERCIRTAVTLAPNSRVVLRSAARFFAHREDPDNALGFLRRSDALRHDPWLLASEISIAEAFGVRSPHAKSAIRLVEQIDTHPLNKTELLGALSTLEFRNTTSQRRARRWLRQAMEYPNENTLAQAEHLVSV